MTTIQTREATKANDDPAEEVVYDGEGKVVDEEEASLEEDDADGKVKAVCQRTPIKSRWIVLSGGNLQHPEFKFLVCMCKLFFIFLSRSSQ